MARIGTAKSIPATPQSHPQKRNDKKMATGFRVIHFPYRSIGRISRVTNPDSTLIWAAVIAPGNPERSFGFGDVQKWISIAGRSDW
jgi:hypothetical protein